MTQILHSPFSNIWGDVRELPLIMFEIRLYSFHAFKMQRGKRRDSKGACLRNIYYPIKMAASETSNYLELTSEMMNDMMGLFSSTNLSLVRWRSAPIHTLRASSFFRLEHYFRVPESARLSDGLSIREYVGRITCACICPFEGEEKKSVFSVWCSKSWKRRQSQCISRYALMLMRILCTCHWLKCSPRLVH